MKLALVTLTRSGRSVIALRRRRRAAVYVYSLVLTVSCIANAANESTSNTQSRGRRLLSSAPEVVLGDRLFFETRFAQYFFAHFNGDVNNPLQEGDPVVSNVERPAEADLAGPFRGQSMSCRHCHLGNDFADSDPYAQRTYCDFSSRSRIPTRNDDATRTVRNTPLMVDLGLRREVPMLLHFDAQFVDAQELIIATLTGRNMGWRFGEEKFAVAHIAQVIREDRGVNPRYVLGQDGKGLSYAVAMLGSDPSVPAYLRIPPEYRVNVQNASDSELLSAVAKLIHAYIDSIRFGTKDTFREAGSPYDLFIERNELPDEPGASESARAYARRLLQLLTGKRQFVWIQTSAREGFQSHKQSYAFGEDELAGLRLFLTEPETARGGERVGMCVACHTPPLFTDHSLHNTGVSQAEYDELFGAGAFSRLKIPGLTARRARPNSYLPASTQHPSASDRFRTTPSSLRPGFADLGAWNIFANKDFPRPQAALTKILCPMAKLESRRCTEASLLPLTIALFKTPSIRDLGHSHPYLHSGHANTIEDALHLYINNSRLAREGRLRNGAPELHHMTIDTSDVDRLAAFLRSLNEDYH